MFVRITLANMPMAFSKKKKEKEENVNGFVAICKNAYTLLNRNYTMNNSNWAKGLVHIVQKAGPSKYLIIQSFVFLHCPIWNNLEDSLSQTVKQVHLIFDLLLEHSNIFFV